MYFTKARRGYRGWEKRRERRELRLGEVGATVGDWWLDKEGGQKVGRSEIQAKGLSARRSPKTENTA